MARASALALVLLSLALALIASCATPRGERGPDGPPQEGAASAVELAAVDPAAGARKAAPEEPETGPEVLPSALPAATAAPDAMVAHFIDVGQGDTTLLEFSCGAMLIDSGGETNPEVSGNARLRAYLEDFFGRRADLAWTLDLVVLSHPHPDHTNGVDVLLAHEPEFTIRNVVDNGAMGSGFGPAHQNELRQAATSSGAGYVGVEEASITSLSGATNAVIDPLNCRRNGVGVDPKLSVLWGRVDLDRAWANNANNDSVVLRVAFGQTTFLFTGDLQKEGINAMLAAYADDLSVFDADVYKVGHHGSHNATTKALLDAVTPRIAVIGAGDSTLSRGQFSAFSFGHPHRDAIDLLTASVTETRPPARVRIGVRGRNPFNGDPPQFTTRTVTKAIYATGWDGNVAIRATANGSLSVETGF
jgi:competence protein ComEC